MSIFMWIMIGISLGYLIGFFHNDYRETKKWNQIYDNYIAYFIHRDAKDVIQEIRLILVQYAITETSRKAKTKLSVIKPEKTDV